VSVPRGIDERTSREVTLTNLEFVEILGVDMDPSWRGGRLRIGGHIDRISGYLVIFRTIYIDVRVVGFLGSKPESIHRAAFGIQSGSIDLELPATAAYSRISVLARLIVDASPLRTVPLLGPGGIGKPTATAHAIARFERGG
jgi:hypothetical protein